MKSASAENISWTPYPGQRSKTIEYKGMLQGEPGTPDNYEMSINRFGVGGSISPRHRHNFDQFRWAFDEPLNYSPKLDVPPNRLGYFPEGAYYGPQDIVEGSPMLIVQFGGASGQGYMSWKELMRGTEELKQKGEFVRGVYTSVNEEGNRFNKDAYEAVWEHVHGRPLKYPTARYREPVVINPEAFEWLPVRNCAGVTQRALGTFSERGTSAFQLNIPAGALYSHAQVPNITLMFVLAGKVRAGNEEYVAQAAFSVSAQEDAQIAASADTLVLGFRMPDFADQPTISRG